jgi:hypothetical protein
MIIYLYIYIYVSNIMYISTCCTNHHTSDVDTAVLLRVLKRLPQRFEDFLISPGPDEVHRFGSVFGGVLVDKLWKITVFNG